MKKIVPFNNVLDFDMDVCEITAISLEHNIKSDNDLISGEFYIMGEYKITDGQLEREKFDFVLPFDIALGSNYDRNTLLIDIDDFRYEIIDRNKLKVAIDLYIDGEILPDEEIMDREDTKKEEYNEIDGVYFETEDSSEEEKLDKIEEENIEEKLEEPEEIEQVLITERIDLLEDMLDNNKKENEMDNTNININNNDNNSNKIDIFNNNSEDKYVTYRVYRVMDNDTIDKIMEKYEISKEELSKYNDLDMIKPGDKLIIPSISK